LDVEVQASGFSKKMAKELELYMKEHGIDGDAKDVAAGVDGEEGEEGDDDDEAGVEDDEFGDEEDGGVSLEGGPVGDEMSASGDTTTDGQPSLTSQMTILEIRDNDPLPDLKDIKPPQPSEPTMTTKAAKKKAGWAI
jgi:RIO kinase 2